MCEITIRIKWRFSSLIRTQCEIHRNGISTRHNPGLIPCLFPGIDILLSRGVALFCSVTELFVVNTEMKDVAITIISRGNVYI